MNAAAHVDRDVGHDENEAVEGIEELNDGEDQHDIMEEDDRVQENAPLIQ